MATTSRITSIATKYGTSSYGTLGRVYAGEGYRTRITFPAVRSAAGIGDANIVVTKVLLHMRRDSGGPATVYAGCSANSAWGAAVDASGSGTIPASTGWHTVDITACAQYILEYGGNWHIHLTGSGTRVRCNGAGSGSDPCIDIVWEYAASTITTGTEKSVLGQPINFEITPRAGDAKFALSYTFGTESGNIAETTSTSISWTPPLAFATEIPNSEIGEMRITMKVYDASDNQIRTEILFVTVTVPETAVIEISEDGVSTVNGFSFTGSVVALAGKTSLRIAPVLDISGAYGASIASLKAEIDNGGTIQTIEWSSLTETNAGIFAGAAQDSAILQSSDTTTVTLTATDTRGREVSEEITLGIRAYANPVITAFSVERYEPVYDSNEQVSGYAPSDIGENVWVTIKASCTNVVASSASRNFLSWKITAKSADGTTATYSGNSGTAQSVSIENSRTIITAVVPAANAVEYTLEVTDTAGYKAYQYYSVAPGRANFALAGSKYGASFGCMPRGTQENPMLESAYPIYAYDGVAYRDLLWMNPNPESVFPAQDIAIDLSRYSVIEIVCSNNRASTWYTTPFRNSYIIRKGSDNCMQNFRVGGGNSGSTVLVFENRYVIAQENRISFGGCDYWEGAGGTTKNNADGLIPVEIYGITKDVSYIAAYASGNPVSFRAASGTAISPVTVLNPKQAGSGDPSPDNIRPIAGYDTLTLNHHGEDAASSLNTYAVQLGQTVCSGRMDWSSGKLVAEYGFYEFDGTLKPYQVESIDAFSRMGFNGLPLRGIAYAGGTSDGLFSHGKYLMNWVERSAHAYVNDYVAIVTLPTTLVGSTVDSVTAYISAQKAAGTPVQIAYKLATPLEIQLTAQQILALAPEQTNTMYGDGDTIEVKYRSR